MNNQKTARRIVTMLMLVMTALMPGRVWADDSNGQDEEQKLGKIHIGDNTIDLDDDESISAFNTASLTIDKREMSGALCVVLTLNDYEYEGTGVDGVGGIKYSGGTPLVLDLNGQNSISVIGDPNNTGATAGVGGQILIFMGDGSLEINMAQDIRLSAGILGAVIASTSPRTMELLEMSAADFKYFTGKITVNNHGENTAFCLYPMNEGYLGGGEYELNTLASGENKIGMFGGLKLTTDASRITVQCPYGRGIAAGAETEFTDTEIEVTAQSAYFSPIAQLPVVESTQSGIEYIITAGNDAQSAVAVDLQAENALETLQAARYMKIYESDEPVTAMPSITSVIPSAAAPCYNLQGQRVNTQQKGIVIKNGHFSWR